MGEKTSTKQVLFILLFCVFIIAGSYKNLPAQQEAEGGIREFILNAPKFLVVYPRDLKEHGDFNSFFYFFPYMNWKLGQPDSNNKPKGVQVVPIPLDELQGWEPKYRDLIFLLTLKDLNLLFPKMPKEQRAIIRFIKEKLAGYRKSSSYKEIRGIFYFSLSGSHSLLFYIAPRYKDLKRIELNTPLSQDIDYILLHREHFIEKGKIAYRDGSIQCFDTVLNTIDTHTQRSRDITCIYYQFREGRRFLKRMQQWYEELNELFDNRFNKKATVHLFPSKKMLQEVVEQANLAPRAVGFTCIEDIYVVSGSFCDAQCIELVIRHELAHLFINSLWTETSCWNFFVEGTAEALSTFTFMNEVVELPGDFDKRYKDMLSQHVKVREIEEYRIAGSFVSFLIKSYGMEKYRKFYILISDIPHLDRLKNFFQAVFNEQFDIFCSEYEQYARTTWIKDANAVRN